MGKAGAYAVQVAVVTNYKPRLEDDNAFSANFESPHTCTFYMMSAFPCSESFVGDE